MNRLDRIWDILAAWRIVPRRNRLGRNPVGRRGERLAAEHLRGKGYEILAMNAITPVGEADIVARREDDAVAIVEVKSRVMNEAGRRGEESVTARKRRKLGEVARHLARANGWRRVCVEVVAVEFAEVDSREAREIRHHRA
jgi:putative endonuclease